MSNSHKHTNKLIESSSPYLLQHAHNPVDWYPWGKEALEKAKNEDKPIIVSIGYSACHWCHVMERESFENEAIAEIMNTNFICIKVDREERPDVDQVYMEAIHAMGLNGGWPLNVFLTPDQKPFYGGTYFNPSQWTQILRGVADAFMKNRKKLEESADKFTESLSTSEIEKFGLELTDSPFTKEKLDEMFTTMARHFDKEKGGSMGAPKFPMPSGYLFLLRYYYATNNPDALKQIKTTLDKMAWGGIYDQIGGGFARYSVDDHWFLPHFEKMLYDNAQLMSLYAEAYSLTGDPSYKQIVEETFQWLAHEMTSPEGGFYCALDADSEGEEGKYYIWKAQELKNLLGDQFEMVSNYYNISTTGNWEHGNNIPFKSISDEVFCRQYHLELTEFQKQVKEVKSTLYQAREKRVRPGLDDKILLGWNAMMSKGLLDAYNATQNPEMLALAKSNLAFLAANMQQGNRLFRNFKKGEASIDAYLEDYALYIDVLITAYQATFDEKYINNAKALTEHVINHFYDSEEGMFFYTDDTGEKLIARKKEIYDNVIPSSNSVMATNLYWLGILFDDDNYNAISREMLSRISNVITNNTGYLSNWASLYFYQSTPTPEIVIAGEKSVQLRDKLAKTYMPNKVLMGTGSLPLTQEKTDINNKETIYVCFNKTCQLPVHTISEALKQIKGE